MKMPCGITCFVAFLIIFSKMVMMYMVSRDSNISNYEQNFSPELKVLYKKIVNERMNIYMQGYTLGLVLSILTIVYLTQVAKQSMSGVSMVCLAITISFFVSYFYYMLSPKSNWMLHHITGEKQVKAWLSSYRSMQYYYHSSLVIGLIGAGVLAYAFRGSCKL